MKKKPSYFKETKRIIQGIEGWLLGNEIRYLFRVAKNCRGKGVIVEIGSWMGKSSACLARGSKAGRGIKVYAIDPFDTGDSRAISPKRNTLEDFERNIAKAGVSDIVIPIVSRSQDAAKDFNESIEILFIDGVHTYKFVKQDFALYFPKVIIGGIIAFHDSNNKQFPGIGRFMRKLSTKPKMLRKIGIFGSIMSWRKISNGEENVARR